MPIFDKQAFSVITDGGEYDLSKASMNQQLSVADFDAQNNHFYVSMDRILFTNPVHSIETILDTHGYVANLENILSCLDSCLFSIHAKFTEKKNASVIRVNDYIPCLSFALPQKHKVGPLLQSFYDEVAKYDSNDAQPTALAEVLSKDARIHQLNQENEKLQQQVDQLQRQVDALSHELLQQKQKGKSDSQSETLDQLPDNTKLCRVEHIDLKKRIVKVKAVRKVFDIPTHMMDRVPEFKSRCLVTFDEAMNEPVSVMFFDSKELRSVEKRVAELLIVDDDTFKARDALRNEFQIRAVNDKEAKSIRNLHRGMHVLISVADNYVVRFAALASHDPAMFKNAIQEQLTVYDIGRNQLVIAPTPTPPND